MLLKVYKSHINSKSKNPFENKKEGPKLEKGVFVRLSRIFENKILNTSYINLNYTQLKP
jgi:hypothetical protein